MPQQQTFVPPNSVRKAARAGLHLAGQFGRGGAGAIDRARGLAKGGEVGISTIHRMVAYFEGYEKSVDPSDVNGDGSPTTAAIHWDLWGGSAGRDWANSIISGDVSGSDLGKSLDCDVLKVDDELGIVFGYAIVCKIDGEDYFDTQGDNIPESAMLEATAEFMAGDRMAKVMHEGGAAGQVVYGFPLTEDIAKAMGIEIQKTGFVVGMKPDDDEILGKFRSGEFTGFSIGGRRVSETTVEG